MFPRTEAALKNSVLNGEQEKNALAGSTSNVIPTATNTLPVPTPGDVEDFKTVYHKAYGIDLTDQEAWEVSTRIFRLFCFVMYGLPESRQEKK